MLSLLYSHPSYTHIRTAVLCSLLSLCLCLTGTVTAFATQENAIPTADTAVSCTCSFAALLPSPLPDVSTSAKAHILIEADSGTVLAQKNADTRLPMASTAKIMTALVALRSLPIDKPISIPAEAVGVEGSSVYLIQGEVLTPEQLLYALLFESANDVAVAIAIAVSGSVSAFADKMNATAAELGLTDTHFTNPHGLDDPDHYTTARELARITQAALEEPLFQKIVCTKQATIPLHGDKGVRLLINHNKLVRQYEGCIGVKTGFTKHTGRCLVSAAERDSVRLIAVTLGCPDDWHDHTTLLDYGFSLCESVTLMQEKAFSMPLWVESGTSEYVMVENRNAVQVTLPRSCLSLRQVVELPRFTYAPITADSAVGHLVWYADTDKETVRLLDIPLYAVSDVQEKTYRMSFFDFYTATVPKNIAYTYRDIGKESNGTHQTIKIFHGLRRDVPPCRRCRH